MNNKQLLFYNFKKYLNMLWYSSKIEALKTNPDIELRNVMGVYLGDLFDFEQNKTLKIFYLKDSNLIVTITESEGHLYFNFYAGIKLRAKIRHVEAHKKFKEFAQTLNRHNSVLPVIPTDEGFYSFFKVHVDTCIKYIEKKDYEDKFLEFVEDSKIKFKSMLNMFSEEFTLDQFSAQDYLHFLFPKNISNQGRKFYKGRGENLLDEVTALLSPLQFQSSYFININSLLNIGKAKIDGKTAMIGAYASKVYKHNSKNERIEVKDVFEVKLQSIFNFVIIANENKFQIGGAWGKALGGQSSISNSDTFGKVKSSIDVDMLKSFLEKIASQIEDETRSFANVRVIRETVDNASSTYRFSFYVIIKEIYLKGKVKDGKKYILHYLSCLKNVSTVIDLVLKKYTLEQYFMREELDVLGIKDSFYMGWDDALLVVKMFENFTGSFRSNKKGDEI
ncbi:MAG: hypothetical protein PF569_06870 [Candidatus Woesearchaeota archaeon]|jgi:hypothetical protein|nr:hypothetical protein [Candidatus Woesearchaeota archaeon]